MEEAKPISLNAFEGRSGPAEIHDAWTAYLGFDEALRTEFPVLLRGILENPEHESNDGRFKAFCTHFEVSTDDLSGVVSGMNLLLLHATAAALPPEGLLEDLMQLGAKDASVCQPVVSMYAEMQPLLRGRLIERSLADHGRLLVGVGWRVDELKISDRGAALDTPIMHLTLRYREGDETSRISLQLVPEMARRLRDACARVVG